MRYELAKGVAIEDAGGITVLTTTEGNAAVLNGTAFAILELLLADCRNAAGRMAAEYDVLQVDVSADVEEVAERLCSWGLLERVA